MAAQVRGRGTGGSDATLTPGQHLLAEMRRLGLDQAALGEAIGVSRQSINNVVNDRQPISRRMAGRLARVTGRPSDYWLRQSFRPGGADEAHGPRHAGVLVQQQILTAVEEGVIGVTPFDRAQVRLASVVLTLHSAVNLTKGELVRAHTRERVELPPDYLARLGPAAELAARGIFALHAPQIEPCFKGHVQLALFNAGNADVPLAAGAAVVSMEVVALAAPAVAFRAKGGTGRKRPGRVPSRAPRVK
jgi:addiction module HigA family antidote